MNLPQRQYLTRTSLYPQGTDCQIHSILGTHPDQLLSETMSIIRLLLPQGILFLALLLLCGYSVLALAWEGHHKAPWVGTTLRGEKCEGGQVPFGPYDYLQRASLQGQLEVVEENHFTPNVESLQSGNTTTAMGDIHYTLQTWPNHHRALNSAFKFRLKHRELWNKPANLQSYPAECYLQRAMNFSPNDPVAFLLYGMLMHQMKQYDKALNAYKTAVKLQPGDLITQYNMGLTLVAMKKYAEAKAIAQHVYSKGFPLPGLKRKLAEVERTAGAAKPTAAKKPLQSAGDKPAESVSDVLHAEATTTAPALSTESSVSTTTQSQTTATAAPTGQPAPAQTAGSTAAHTPQDNQGKDPAPVTANEPAQPATP